MEITTGNVPDIVVILSSIAISIYMEITTGNVPDTVVILRDQAEEFPLCQWLYI